MKNDIQKTKSRSQFTTLLLGSAGDKRRFEKFVLLDDGSLGLYLLEEIDEEFMEQLTGYLYISFLVSWLR